MARAEWNPQIRRVRENERDQLLYVGSLMRERRMDEARAELEGILKKNGRSYAANLTLGRVYQNMRKQDQAAEYFKKAITIDPLRAQGHVFSGYNALRSDKSDEAAAAFKTAIDIDQKLVTAHVGLSRVLQRQGDVESAIARVGEAVRLDPQSVRARVLLAQLLNQSGKTGEAIEQLEGFIKTRPGQVMPKVLLSMYYSKGGKHRQAADLLESAVQTQAASANLWMLLGRAKRRLNDHEGAEAAFREAMKLRPRSARCALRVVDTLLPQKKLDEALRILGRLRPRGQTSVLTHKYYGDIFVAQNNLEEAVRSYHAAIVNSKDGEKRIAGIEKALGGETNPEAQLKVYAAEIEKMEKALREALGEVDWPLVLRRLRPRPAGNAFGAADEDDLAEEP